MNSIIGITHFQAIHGFRETERLQWNEQNTIILRRIRDIAFPDSDQTLGHVHILDLSEKGHIKPHIDSVRFCGNTIAGLSLLSDSVMRLAHEKNKDVFADVLLKRRSMYIMKDSVRYDFTHEILPNSESKFKGETIHRLRRISLMCRNKPSPS
ncbi:alpha-ketoglutarate-dependent dioxygenase alkB homolog 7, mitochondrial isoform X2 [Nilaparvata lugens]|uniref:alpha-ketoglutarate-dependent dioxygenase alkB homolog 7, mitochondrial isoform X2 n=1 Tax=Nilaparvata lugens TaxID=108931 RepID=UPI000B98E979|nr:alpha-ketoglutarate-dependent dioxygenase alkB homolog 7, mitochondrial isoform X2 [Nilaparvata lugens]